MMLMLLCIDTRTNEACLNPPIAANKQNLLLKTHIRLYLLIHIRAPMSLFYVKIRLRQYIR
jgi:hypothetical protein